DALHPLLLRWPRDLRWLRISRAEALRSAALFGVLVVTAAGYGAFRLATPPKVTDTIEVSLIQQNIDSWLPGNEWRSVKAAQDLTREALAEREERPDLIVWSETILRRPFPENRSVFRRRPEGDPFIPFVRSLPAPLVTGAPSVQRVDPFEPVNSAILLDNQGRHYGFYGKRHLVPMAENVPFWDVPIMRRFFENVVGVVGVWAPGDRWAVFAMPRHPARASESAWEEAGVTARPPDPAETGHEVGTSGGDELIRFGTPICYEDSFGYLCREFALLGADLLINVTNNSWSETRSAQIQHFVSSRYRAVENRMALARSTNSGYTAVIDATGAVQADMPMFVQGYLNVAVPLYGEQGLTFYSRFGDYLARFWILVSIATLVGLLVRDKYRI
ncbi:MAG: apolipoprotein N-acyltransferase, partial [Spirochaetota bacterium]